MAARRAAEIARSAEEQATQEYVASKAKRCPECEAPGEKVSGCDHMTCKLVLVPTIPSCRKLANLQKVQDATINTAGYVSPTMAQSELEEIRIIVILAITIPITFQERQAMMRG